MQVERISFVAIPNWLVANGCVTRGYIGEAGNSPGKLGLMPHVVARLKTGTARPVTSLLVCGLSASWRGNGPPRQRRVAGLRGRPATLELRHGPDTYGWQQSRIFHNGGNPDGATPRGG